MGLILGFFFFFLMPVGAPPLSFRPPRIVEAYSSAGILGVGRSRIEMEIEKAEEDEVLAEFVAAVSGLGMVGLDVGRRELKLRMEKMSLA